MEIMNISEIPQDNQNTMELVDKTIEITSELTNEIINTYKLQLNTVMSEYIRLLDILTQIISQTDDDYQNLISELKDELLASKERIQMLNSTVIENPVNEITPPINNNTYIPSEDELVNLDSVPNELNSSENETFEEIEESSFGEYSKILKL